MRAVYGLALLILLAYVTGVQVAVQHGEGLWLYWLSHGPGWHLWLNLLALVAFGLGVERHLGPLGLLVAFLGSALAAGLLHALMLPDVPMIGASGGVFGLMALYACLEPRKRVYLLALPMQARWLVVAYLGLEVASLAFGWFPHVAHWAHLGGMAMGLIFYWRVKC